MVYTYEDPDLKSSRRHVYVALYGVAIVPLAFLALAFVWILATGVQIPHFSIKSMLLTKDGGHMHVTTPPVARTNS